MAKKFEIKLTTNERFPLLSAIEFSDDELGKPKWFFALISSGVPNRYKRKYNLF